MTTKPEGAKTVATGPGYPLKAGTKDTSALSLEGVTGHINVDSFIKRNSNSVPIGGDVAQEGGTEEEEEKLLPEGMEMTGLDSNIYSLIFTGSVKGPGFWFGLLICAFQTSIIYMAIHDSIDWKDDKNPLQVPAGNELVVTVARGALMFILPQLADDMMQGLEFLIDGYHPEVLELCPYASMWAWALSGFLHTGVGAALIFMVFNLLMQQTSVVNLGLKYCAFGFFAKIDDVAFTIAKKGVCSVPLQKEIKTVGKVEIRKHTEYTWSRRIRDSLLTAGLMLGWAILTYQQLTGRFLCDQLFVQVGDIFNPDIVELSGIFDMLDFYDKVASRAVYQDRETQSIQLAYCKKTSKWTMTELNDDGDLEPCENIIASSKTDKGYSILATADSWSVTPALRSGSKPFTHFYMACNECSSKCKTGSCDDDNHCVCEPGHFGVNCEYDTPCSDLTLNLHTKPFPAQFLGLESFPTDFKLLAMADGSEGTKSDVGTFQVEYRPVYYGAGRLHHYLLFFAGRRWVITDASMNDEALENKTAVVDYLSDPTKFNHISSFFSPSYASSPMDVGTPSDAASPDKLNWFNVRKCGLDDDSSDCAWWEVAEDEPVDAVLHCAFCDQRDNPCENGATCNFEKSPGDQGICECFPGTKGSLCEYEVLCTDPQDDDASKTMGCEGGGTCTATGKCSGCSVGYVGSRCQLALPCSAMTEIVGGECFRGGTCDQSAVTGGCTCPEPYNGPHCQFPNATDLDMEWDF